MEGDGEGMVAIVQGLDSTGVTLTVCSRARHNSDRRRSSRPRIQINAGNMRPDMTATDQRSHTFPVNVANERSSVETSTGTDISRQHRSSQICDGRYASSYKLAHCMVTPTSPPEAVSEFPPQRNEPCRNQGNFEIGGHGSGHSNGKVRVSSSRVRHYGGSQTWGDNGSSHRYRKSNRDTEAFAHSLRKYPSMAPFRTASTDLIEKLIRYTQARNFHEMSRSSKSMRSLRQQKTSDTYDMAKASKYQQTYTRRQDDNVANNSNVQVGYRGRAREFKLYSPTRGGRNVKGNRHRETTFSSSYDYLKAGNCPYGHNNRSDESPSPVGSSSPERTRSPESSRSPDGLKSPEETRSPVRFRSIDGFKNADGFRSYDRPNRPEKPIRYERSVRELSLSDMSKHIRSTIRQICNERPVVLQVCPKLKNRFDQHKKICPNKNDKARDITEDEPEEVRASGSVISRLIQSFSGCPIPSTEQAGCQCTRTDCYCTKATQCVNNPDASTNTIACSCKTPTKTGCCRGMPCVCANKSQDQAYYNKRIDEEISEWLKDVPVHSIEGSDSKKKRDTVVKELRKTLKQLPDDNNFDDNARNEIKSFIDDFPLWNPGKDKKDEKLFKNQLADKLTERIISVPRKPDRFRDIVKKWILNMDFEDDGEDVDKETIIDKFVNKLKSVAVDRPACDIKYTQTLRKEIIELLVELALKFDGDMVMLKKMANKLATEIVSIPRNVNLSGDTTDLTDEFEDNVCDWICEHGLCGELKKDPKLIEGLARKLNRLKSQGIDDECVVEKIKEEIYQFVDDVGIAIETMDELIDELMKQLSNTVQTNEMERLDQDELTEVFIDWLSNLPGASDLHPRKLEKIVKELVKVIIEGREQGNENLANDILNYLVDADLSIDPADLGIHVDELMDKLNLLPSNKYYKEQVKKALIKNIFDVIENMSISQGKKEKLRNKTLQVVEKHLLNLSSTAKEAHDDMKEAIMEDMDDAISSIDIPKESRLKLKASLSNMLNSNFDKSFTRLKRLTRDGSNLKQTIAKDVRNAVKELPIDKDKKKDLMQQVKGTLSKNMHKPLPSNVKSTINDEISDIVERCPTAEDKSIIGSLKQMLSAVASKHLNIFLPKCVCDIQNKVEKDVGIVIDRSSIDTGKKKELKKSIQDILTENEDRHLSDEVLRTIKKDINGVVSDLSIPQDKKDVLKKAVGETISKDFNESLSNLRHDLNNIRNKLFEDICKIIEKSPISRDVKTHLINKLKFMLARNLDSSLSDEEKYTILDDVSNIVKDDMPEEQRRNLTNKLAKKLDTQQRKEDANEIDQLTKNLKELENKILEYILREMGHAVEEAPIPREKKIELKQKLNDLATINYKKPAEDIAEALIDGLNEILDELNLPKDKKNELKSELAAAIDEYSKLLSERKDVETKYLQLKRRSSADTNGKHKQIGKGLMPMKGLDENKVKDNILQSIEDIIKESAIPEEKKMKLKTKLKEMAADNLKKPFSDDMQDAIKIGITDILDELQIPKSEKDKLKRALINMTDENMANLRDVDKAKAKECILQGIEKIIKESAIPEEKKMELKLKLKNLATDNLKMPFSDDLQDAIKMGIVSILDELQIPKSEKDKLKRALINMTNDNFDNLREANPPIEEDEETKANEPILQGIEQIIEGSAIPEGKKMELKSKLKKMASVYLKKPLSEDVQDAIKIGIIDILDEVQIPKPEKDKLKRALINMSDENVLNLRDVDKTKAKERILQGIEKIIEESAIPEEKKMELKRKLKNLATDNLKMPFSDDVQDTIKMGIADIIDELQIPKSEKDKLKRALINMTNDNFDNLREAIPPIEEVDETKAKESILQGIEQIIKESAIPEGKKMEFKRKLKNLATDNLKKPFNNDVQHAIKIGIADILDELQIPKPEKNKLERALVNMTNDNLDNLREVNLPIEEVDKTKAKERILQGIEQIIEESAIPEGKKMELKRKLKNLATDNLEMPFSDDVQDVIKMGIADILDELQIPKSEKDKLKRALINMTNNNLDNLREANPPIEVYETKANKSILQGIEKIIEESAIPEGKKVKLKRKLKKMASDNLKELLSEDVQDAIKIGIADILDELQIPKSEKDKLKSALINMTDENVANLQDVDKTQAIESILHGIEKIIEESAIPEGKTMELKRKLKNLATDNLKMPFSDDVQDAIEMGICNILDELKIPKPEKNKLKRALINMTHDKMDDLREANPPIEEVDETKAKERILQGIEKIIEESAIPEGKKMELKKKLKNLATDNLKTPFSDDVHGAIKMGIGDILDELQIPKSEKDKLKSALINMTDENMANLRDVDKAKAKECILQGIENIIKESAIPEEKKMELKRKLKNLATDNLKMPFSDDVQDAIKMGIGDIIDELQIPKPEKNKLKRALINMTNDNLDNLREVNLPIEEVDETKAKKRILQGIEKIIEESAIPEGKKMELKRKLKKTASDNFNKLLSEDVQDAIKIGIADILDELQIPKSEKDKLKRALINMTDENVANLRDVDKTKAKERILQGIEKIIEESAIPEGKKMELKRKLKKMASDNLNKLLSEDVQDAIKIGIADILDELQIPKSEKDKLKRALINMTDENVANLRDVDKTKAKERILQGIEKIIEESAIPEGKKMELKRKLKKMASDNLNKLLSEDVQDAIKIGIADILDELQIPKSEKDKLKRALINMTDENVANLRDVDKTKAKERILQGIEKIIEESAIPEGKKMELKRKLKKMASDNLNKLLSEDVQDAIKIGIADILDELQIPKSEKDKLKRALINMTDENVANLRDVDKTKAKERILQGIEKIIEESAIPEGKKMELKRKLKKMASDNLNKLLSEDVQDAIKIGIADILDELQIPKSEKDKLKRALINMTDENVANLRDVDKTKAKERILQGIEQIIEESAIPEGKKMELKRKLKNLATDNLKKPFNNDVQHAIKIGIADILDELQIPKPEKNKLERALVNMANDNLDNLREVNLPIEEVDETKAKERILQRIEKIIEESAIPEEKKMELKRKLKNLATDNLKMPFSVDVQDAIKMGIGDILDKLQIPKSEKDKLKRAFINMTDENVANLRDVDKTKAKERILQGIEKIIEESAIPEGKKMELKRKLKKMASDNLNKLLSEDVQDATKIGIADILDELQIPKSEKDKLKRALINMTYENVANLRDVDKTKAKERILQGIEQIIEESAIPEGKKMELKRKLKKMASDNLNKLLSEDVQDAIKIGIADILDELQIPKSEKDKLKRALINMTDENVANLRDVDKTKAKERILQGIEKIIEESAIPEGKKMELKRKLKKMASDNLNKLLSEDVQDAIKIGIADILDELQIPKSEKDKLKRALINMTDENVANLRDVDKTKAKERILQGIEKIIEESAIPEGKKMELKRKLKKMASDNLNKLLSEDVQDAIKIGIADILDELQIPKSEKDKLKRALINMTDENVANLRDVDKTKAKERILQGIEKIIEESAIPEGKKMELKRKLKNLATDNLIKPLSEDVQDAIKIGIGDILDELQISKREKNKLKRALINMANDNLDDLREANPPIVEVDATKAKERILQGIEKIIEESAIPEEKKMELKRKLKNLATDNLKIPFSDDVQHAIKIGIADILDELQIPKPEKNKLERALVNMANDNLDNLREVNLPIEEVDETKAKKRILQGIEKIIEESAIPEEKKLELKRKLKNLATDNLKIPFSDDVQDAIKMGISDILDELQIPKPEKNKLKRALINMTNDNLDNLREAIPPIEEVDETKAKESILQGIEQIIQKSAIPEGKKMELKNKLKNLASDNLKKPFSDDVEDAIKIGIAEILDELQIPKAEKNKIKRALINTIDENFAKLRSVPPKLSTRVEDLKVLQDETQKNILLGFEEAIDEAPIPIEKKKELKKKLTDMATKNYQKSLSDDITASFEDDINEIIEELNSPIYNINKLKSDANDSMIKRTRSLVSQAKQNMVDDSVENFRDTKQVKPLKGLMPIEEVDETNVKESVLQGIEKIIEESAIPKEKKMEFKRKLKKMAIENLKKPFSDDVQDAIKIGTADILDELQIPKSEKNKLRRALLNMVEENDEDLRETKQIRPLKGQRPKDEIDKAKARERISQGIEKSIEESAIPKEKKMEFKRKLKNLATDNLKKPFSDDVQDAIKIGITDILDELQVPNSEKNKLKRALLNMVEENVDNLRGVPLKLSSHLDDFKELESETQNNILLGFEKAIDEAPISIDKKKELKKKLKDMATKNFEISLSDDTAEAIKDGIHEILDELKLPKDKKNKLKSELTAAVDENLSNFKNETNLAKSVPDAKRNKLNIIIRRVLPQFDEAVDPSYQKQLAEEFDELLEIALTDGDFKDARRKLIKKLMREQNLSKKEASAPVDELIGRAREMALNEDMGDERYELDPSYVKTLEADINDLVSIALVGGDFEDARRKLTKKLMREQTLLEEEAIAYADDLIGKAQKLALAAQSKDKSLLHRKALAKAISDAVDQSTLSEPDKSGLKNKLLNKMKQTIDKKPFINKDDLEHLKSEVFNDLKKIVDASSIPTDKKNEFKSLLNEKLTNTIDEIMDHYDDEEGYTKDYTKAISKAVNKSPIPNLEKNYLKRDLAKTFDRIMDDYDEDKITKHKEAFSKAINNAVDLSTLSKPDRRSLKNKLLNKMEQTVDESPHINDIGALKAEVLKYCKNLVDVSSIPIGKKNELKILLKEEIMDDYNDEETFAMEESPEHEDKISEYKEAFSKAITNAVDQSTLSKPYKKSLKNKLLNKMEQTVDESPHINDTGALKAEVLKDCKNLVDVSSIPIGKQNELKILLKEKIMDDYDDEETFAMEECPEHEDKISEYKEAFSKAITNAVDQSTLSKPYKKSLKNKLLNKMEQTVDESPHINDTGALEAEVLKDCKNLVDVSSIPIGKQNELKILLKEKIMDDYDDEETFAMEERPEHEDKISEYKETFTKAINEAVSNSPVMDDYDESRMENKLKKYKEAFARAINDAVDQSTLSKPNKSSQKNKLLSKLNQTIDNSPHLNDISALIAEVLKDSKKVVDVSPIPTDKKNELKLLLHKALEEASIETMDVEEVSRDAFAMFKDKIAETVKTWMGSLPIDLDPKVATVVAKDIASDILDRQKYLQVHPEAVSTDKDEIENLKYQIFRRMKNLVDPKDIPPIMEGTEELYRMIMDIEPPPGFPKLRRSSLREQSTSEKQRRDPEPKDRKKSTSFVLSTGNINYSLKELIATSKSVRKQWSRNLDEAVTKLHLQRNENCFLREKLAIYDETGQINMLSSKSRAKEETSTVQGSKSKKHVALKPAHVAPKLAHVAPKPAQKNNKGKLSSRLSKIDKALTFHNTTKQQSPFTPKSNQGVDEKEFTKFTTDTIKAWLKRVRVNIEPDAMNKIIEELTDDIVHRKKYVQVFGSTEPSRSDDLEYLKVQVHRRLHGILPTEALKVVIVDTKELLTKLDTVKIKVTPVSANVLRSQKTGKKQGITDILDIKAKATNTYMNEDEEEMEKELSNMEFSPGQTSTPGKPNDEPTGEEYKAKVEEAIRTWIESVSIDLEPEAKTDFIEKLTNDLVDRNNYLQIQPGKTISKEEEIENLRFRVFKRLSEADPDASVTPGVEEVEKLYKMIGDGRRKILTPKQTEEFRTALNEEISAILDDYNICCDRRELHPSIVKELTKLGKSNADQDEIVENLIKTIKRHTYLSACVCDEEAEELAHKLLYRTKKLIARIQEKDHLNSADKEESTPVKKQDFKEAMMKDMGKVFNGSTMSNEKPRLMESQLAEDYAKDLVPLEDSSLTMDGTGPESKKERYGMSFNGLTNFIDTWLSSIHTDDDTKEEDEIKDMKKDMAYSLIHKIGEMNVDPEIFNDDSLYETVLRDELQNLLSDITISDDELQALKEDLIEKVLEAQHRAHDEIAGQVYKQKLRDTISKLLSDLLNLSKEEQATMETLKDQLADAYIDLHYTGGNENQRERLKRKIADGINNFCRDYLYRNPCSPLNSRTLNNNLYTALNKIPLPIGDSIRYEVEQARIRDEINDWIKELPLQPQNPTEVLARNKLVYVLSKKLFDIEVEGDDTENELMKKEIIKFLNKMPLESGENNDTLADKLIDKLKATEESRKYDASSNVIIDAFGNVSAASSGSGMDAPVCPAYEPLATASSGSSGSPKVCRRPCPKQPKPFPPCTLNPEDRAHLESIKRRTCLSPGCVNSFMRNNKRDTGVGPRPVNAGSQTVLRPFGMEKQQSPICPVDNEKTPRPCLGFSANLVHPPCSHARRDSFEIKKPPPSPICPAAHEDTPRPCPAGPSRPSLQSGHQMRRHTISSNNTECPIGEVQPQIIIKQYYWDPNEKNSIAESDLQQSGRSSRRQSDPAPCPQPGPGPRHQTGSASCDQTRTSSYAEATPAPYHRPSSSKLQQQNTSPQGMPCDQTYTCPEPKSQHQPSPERYSYWDPQRSFQRPSQRDTPSSRSSCTPSPCMSPLGLNQQSSPPCSTGFSKRDHECRMPKRDGLQDQMPCSSRPYRKERVIELGSLDDVPNARPKKRHSDQSDWTYTKFQEDDNFWGVPMRRVILDEGIDETVVMEREQREERIRCRCKERLIPKSGRSQPRTCPSQETPQGNEDEQNLKRCSKCCGRHCPYPSFLYFRQ